MILCDACGKGWHVGCLRPRLTSLPEGDWVCERCKEEGLSAPARRVGEAAWSTPRLALDKKRDEEKRLLHGRTVAKLFKDDKTGEDRLYGSAGLRPGDGTTGSTPQPPQPDPVDLAQQRLLLSPSPYLRLRQVMRDLPSLETPPASQVRQP